ncbi:small membrane protein YohP [Geminicoccus roseus]
MPRTEHEGHETMLKFIGGTVGIIFLIGLLVVIGLLALIF